MLRFVLIATVLPWLGAAEADCSNPDSVSVDFSRESNPALGMTWQNAAGTVFNGADPIDITKGTGEVIQVTDMVKSQQTDATEAPFPGGSLTWTNVGIYEGQEIDLRVVVPEVMTTYSETLHMEYKPPLSATGTQAALTPGGYACLGLALQQSNCGGWTGGTGEVPVFDASANDGNGYIRCPSGAALHQHGATRPLRPHMESFALTPSCIHPATTSPATLIRT
jgi:hypothetical protein